MAILNKFSPEQREAFWQVLEMWSLETKPGVILHVSGSQPEIEWAGAKGPFVIGEERAVQTDTPFRIASVSKTMTAVTALRLVEEGLMELDAPLARVLPAKFLEKVHVLDEVNYGEQITLRQVLNHTSGVFDYISAEPFLARIMQEPMHQWSPGDLIEQASTLEPPYFAPGQGFHYSDTGYVLAGLAIEEVTKRPLHEVYRQYIFEPLEMNATYLEGYEEPRGGEIAHHYLHERDLTPVNMSFDWAGGGLVSTGKDLVRFMHELMEGRVLSEESLREMMTWVPELEWEPGSTAHYEKYGLGLGAITAAGEEVVGGTGAWGAFMWYWKEAQVVISGTINDAGVDRTSLFDALVRVLVRP